MLLSIPAIGLLANSIETMYTHAGSEIKDTQLFDLLNTKSDPNSASNSFAAQLTLKQISPGTPIQIHTANNLDGTLKFRINVLSSEVETGNNATSATGGSVSFFASSKLLEASASPALEGAELQAKLRKMGELAAVNSVIQSSIDQKFGRIDGAEFNAETNLEQSPEFFKASMATLKMVGNLAEFNRLYRELSGETGILNSPQYATLEQQTDTMAELVSQVGNENYIKPLQK